MIPFLIIENIVICVLVGFLCWLFKSGWPTLLMLFMTTSYTSKKHKQIGEKIESAFTEEEYEEFRELIVVEILEDKTLGDFIFREDVLAFCEKHGSPKCNAMFERYNKELQDETNKNS